MHTTFLTLVWYDPKVQHHSSIIVGIEEPFRLDVIGQLRAWLLPVYLFIKLE